ncbi:pimeloyl-ACP methyl ester carboxylesterase [Stackebrandtia endophytica]|uniref:Pimeloyl-ACP methyl ester carboxylesterase n=1 Tax=Stackebrandtia endophytica TaxID=1496996 RepID=A0A543AY68_9ACTN|nr:alpha/beta hydrolase [Stackebrandtia endophytica]TQL77518.1 pimeloyl-ACP methyl ester carboxylesterase [Stackebrandtia endophytica]
MTSGNPANFILIHGGGSSSWDWHRVAPLLRERGHHVVAVDLPIEDDANGMSEYADAVVAECRGLSNLVIVGHSFGGQIAPVVCSRVEADLLVYLSGMVPLPGESFAQWWSTTGHDALNITLDTRQQEIDVFMNDLSPELVAEAFEHARDHAFARAGEPSPLTEQPDVPTRFILCRDDRFFPPEFMRPLVAERLGLTPDEIDGGHLAALSNPRGVADRLDRYWSELAG